MITTDRGAYQEMAAAVRVVANSTAMITQLNGSLEVRYNDVIYKDLPDGSKFWVRFALAQAGEKRRTISKPARITQHGIANIQLFTPLADKNGADLGSKVAALLKTVYSKSTASVDFFQAAIRDMPREEKWFCKQITATYNYDTRG